MNAHIYLSIRYLCYSMWNIFARPSRVMKSREVLALKARRSNAEADRCSGS